MASLAPAQDQAAITAGAWVGLSLFCVGFPSRGGFGGNGQAS